MKNTDRFLIGIIAGVVLLVIVAFAITLTRPQPTYQAEDTPEGVAHNYLLALQKKEYGRAYGYLSPAIEGYPPSEIKFVEATMDDRWRFRGDVEVTLAVESVTVTGERAVVQVRESSFRGGNLFDSSQSSILFEMVLRRTDEGWRIFDSEYYFAWCWKTVDGCK
ncbi:MAG: hypothetical protein ISS56_15835 [Anaerolineae bacterium]|jgi:hypothetical protein|nr:hypothetical protein [Anaerolineae bacterium]